MASGPVRQVPAPTLLLDRVVTGVGIPLSLAAALAFHHLVERPSRRLATQVGRGLPLRSGA
ncbi:hypothetical protein [Modestobacter sp. URMC 112]